MANRTIRTQRVKAGKVYNLHTACTGRVKLWVTPRRPRTCADAQRSNQTASAAGPGRPGMTRRSAALLTQAGRAASGAWPTDTPLRRKQNIRLAAVRLIGGRTGQAGGFVAGQIRQTSFARFRPGSAPGGEREAGDFENRNPKRAHARIVRDRGELFRRTGRELNRANQEPPGAAANRTKRTPKKREELGE